MEYFGTFMPCTRGFRNNNPLNIKRGEAWQGLIPYYGGGDNVFCQFSDISYGIRAAFKILMAYKRRGVVSVHDIIATWAPSKENNVTGYVTYVCAATGLKQTQHLTAQEYLRLVQGMAMYESKVQFQLAELQQIYEKSGVSLEG